MKTTIKVNGTERSVVNCYSSGPGCTPHTYELKGGATVSNIGRYWVLEHRGQGAWIPELSVYGTLVEVVL